MKISKKLLVLILVSVSCPWVAFTAETADENVVHMNMYEFKKLLDDGQIISVAKDDWGGLWGDFKSNSETNAYNVETIDYSSPFLAEAVEKHGLKLEHKIINMERSGWDFDIGYIMSEVLLFLIFGLQIFLFVSISKLRKRSEK